MRLESQYRLRWRRGSLVLVGAAFVISAVAAPSVHLVDGRGSGHPAVGTTSGAGAVTQGFQVASPLPVPGEPASSLPARHLDCLTCAVLTMAASAGSPPASQETAILLPTLAPLPVTASVEVRPLGTALPRAPPSA